MQRPSPGPVVGLLVAPLVAFCFSAASGAFMAAVVPAEKWSAAWWAVAPLWLLVEVVFEACVHLLGSYSSAARVLTTVAVFAGFYGAWFLTR